MSYICWLCIIYYKVLNKSMNIIRIINHNSFELKKRCSVYYFYHYDFNTTLMLQSLLNDRREAGFVFFRSLKILHFLCRRGRRVYKSTPCKMFLPCRWKGLRNLHVYFHLDLHNVKPGECSIQLPTLIVAQIPSLTLIIL